MRAKGMTEEQYEQGGQVVNLNDNEAHLKTGSLAGSIIKMNDGLRKLLYFTGDKLDTLW
ncbi:N-acetylglucosamine-6-phosphate deacetylase, partial [Staphylococcus felis]